jgi:hypothetical protein
VNCRWIDPGAATAKRLKCWTRAIFSPLQGPAHPPVLGQGHIAAGPFNAALQADGVVFGDELEIGDKHPLARIDIEAIIVVVGAALDSASGWTGIGRLQRL